METRWKAERRWVPQADSKQAEAIAKYLEIGAQDGVALTGGKRATDKGENFITPTVFTDLSDTSRLNVEEIFGPVMVMHEFETEEEAVRRANDTECEAHSQFSHFISVLTFMNRWSLRISFYEEHRSSFACCPCPGSWKCWR